MTALGGCTSGVIVDADFKPIPGMSTPISFVNINRDTSPPTLTSYNARTASGYFSFDPYAPENASVPGFEGLFNQQIALLPGEYFVSLPEPPAPFLVSSNFMHTYDGNCPDQITGALDPHCEQYYLQVDYECAPCAGPDCTAQPLPLHGGVKVITLCGSGSPGRARREYPRRSTKQS